MGAYNQVKAVNFVLQRGNQPLIHSLDTDSSSAARNAILLLDQKRIRILTAGLQFNTVEKDFNPDINGHIQFGASVLSVDNRQNLNTDKLTMRGVRLWNVTKGTDVFTQPIKLRVVYDWDFEQIATNIQLVIMGQAALTYNKMYVGDRQQIANIQRQLDLAVRDMDGQELRSLDIDMVAKSPLGKIAKSGLYRRIR